MSEEMKFDLTITSIPVTIGNNRYTMKEADSGTVTQYRNMILNNTKMGPTGKPQTLKNIAGAETFLISKCMWNSQNKNPTLDEVRAWPSRITNELFKKIKEISGMDVDDEEEEDEDNSEEATSKKS